MNWPESFPPNCPPDIAVDAVGKVYRLVLNSPPQSGDFMSNQQLNPRRDWGRKMCKACGLSVFTDLADFGRLARRVAAVRNRPGFVAEGTLNPSLGKIEPTPSQEVNSHYTWWLPLGAEPAAVFSVLRAFING